jgi:DNA-binding CsgD family transcriptional regulator
MVRERQLADLIGGIYDAALDAEHWPTVLEDLVRLTHSNTGTLAEINLANGATKALAAVDIPRKGFFDYEAHYWQQDIWTPKPGTFEVGRVYSSQRTISSDVLLRSRFYHDWMKPLRLFYGLGGIPLVEGQTMLLIGVHRPRSRQRAYGDQDIGLFQQLFPHFRRALQIHHRLDTMAVEREALAETADRLLRGIFTFDVHGRLLWANRTGEEICRQNDGLSIQRGSLTAALPAETRQLQQLLHDAIQTANGGNTSAPDAMLIARPSGRRPYVLLVSPLHVNRRRIDDQRPTVVVFASDPEWTPEVPAARLSHLYGLTPAEAQLAQQLASGLDLCEIAEASHRTRNTVRTQLKQVFHKTGTRRQAELVRLVLQAEGAANGDGREI